jgi:nucleoredoxin
MSYLPFTTILGKDNAEIPSSTLDGKLVALYFSASWCRPCVMFTPVLTQKYNEIKASEDADKLEVIFISADQSEEEANHYYEKMPWKRLAYDQDKISELMTRYEVDGFPTVVLLDIDGTVLSNDAGFLAKKPFSEWKVIIDEKKAAAERFSNSLKALQSQPFNPVTFFDSIVVDKEKNEVNTTETFRNKIIGLYFSAHWCPPCRMFTPQLVKKYEEWQQAGQAVEIIFISSDQSEDQYNEYYESMPWKRMKFTESEKKQLLSAFFEIRGIPSLVFVSEEHGLITKDGRSAAFEVKQISDIVQFEEEKRIKEAKLAAEIWWSICM